MKGTHEYVIRILSCSYIYTKYGVHMYCTYTKKWYVVFIEEKCVIGLELAAGTAAGTAAPVYIRC